MTAERHRQAWDDPAPPPLQDPNTGAETDEHITREGDGGFALAARYRLDRCFGAGLFVGRDWLGHSSGYREGLIFGESIHFDPVILTTALLAAFHATPPDHRIMMRLEAGPALYRARAVDGDDVTSRFGPLVGAGLGLSFGQFGISVEAQRRFVGDVRYGPYSRSAFTIEPELFEEATASFDHYALLFGAGYAF